MTNPAKWLIVRRTPYSTYGFNVLRLIALIGGLVLANVIAYKRFHSPLVFLLDGPLIAYLVIRIRSLSPKPQMLNKFKLDDEDGMAGVGAKPPLAPTTLSGGADWPN